MKKPRVHRETYYGVLPSEVTNEMRYKKVR